MVTVPTAKTAKATRPTQDLPIRAFKTPRDWKKWLQKNHATVTGIWVRFYKKHSGVPSVTYAEALDEALCYGWIDSQVKRYDEQSYLQRFSPRRRKSFWSRINVGHIERLTAEGRMQPSGLAEVSAARADGRWDAAYGAPSKTQPPADFKKALARNKKAAAFFATLNRTNTYAICWRIESAKKPETRERRIAQLIEMLAEQKKLY